MLLRMGVEGGAFEDDDPPLVDSLCRSVFDGGTGGRGGGEDGGGDVDGGDRRGEVEVALDGADGGERALDDDDAGTSFSCPSSSAFLLGSSTDSSDSVSESGEQYSSTVVLTTDSISGW